MLPEYRFPGSINNLLRRKTTESFQHTVYTVLYQFIDASNPSRSGQATKPNMAKARNNKHVQSRKSNYSANINPASVMVRQNPSSSLTNKKNAMSFFLPRRKPICFYCGCRSANKRDGEVRQWECEKCEAVNYLDEVRSAIPGSEKKSGLTSRETERRNHRPSCYSNLRR